MKRKYKRADYHILTRLSLRQRWLLDKEDELEYLLSELKEESRRSLVISLLEQFNYLDSAAIHQYNQDISEYIVEDSGFEEQRVQVLSMTYDEEADSGQRVLDQLKVPLYKRGWRNFKTVNQFGKSVKQYKQGRDQVVIVDEFIGSGNTIRSRINYLEKNIPGKFECNICIIAGMENSIKELQNDGHHLFCPLQLPRGISDLCPEAEVDRLKELMVTIENDSLSQLINHKELHDYHLGYGQAEALYTLEGANGNTPNSVFPIFWWRLKSDNEPRPTLLTRYETGM